MTPALRETLPCIYRCALFSLLSVTEARVNFAEQLTYWYLRLNGFVPLTNFVLHHDADRNANRRTSDADLIAIRFPHVSEVIGGQADDWDEQFERWNLRLTTETIGLIVEVKSGRLQPKDFKAPNWRVPSVPNTAGSRTAARCVLCWRSSTTRPAD